MEFDIESIEDIKVAVAEACTNAIEHGCPPANGDCAVVITFDLGEDDLSITVHDPGSGFDPESATRLRSRDAAPLTERGLGMLLIESLMDSVEFRSVPGAGTLVRMVKRRSRQEGCL